VLSPASSLNGKTPQGLRFAVPAFRDVVFRLPAPSPVMLDRRSAARELALQQSLNVPFDPNFLVFRGLFHGREPVESPVRVFVFADCVHTHSTRDTLVCRYLDEFFVPEAVSDQAHDSSSRRCRIDPFSFDCVPNLTREELDRSPFAAGLRLEQEYLLDLGHPLRTAIQHWLSQRIAVSRAKVNVLDAQLLTLLKDATFVLHACERSARGKVVVCVDCYVPRLRCRTCPPPSLSVIRVSAALDCEENAALLSDDSRVDFAWTKTFSMCVSPDSQTVTKHTRVDARMSPLLASCLFAKY
jgi:hypothetical protein